MNRKLVKQAGQAITITLPIGWIRRNNLVPGEEIEVEEKENELILRSGKKVVTGSIKIDTENFNRRMRYVYLNAAYAKGVDQIELFSDKNDYPDLNQNIGYAVVKQKDKQFTIRDISGVSSENLDDIFKRVFQMIIAFYESALEDLFHNTAADIDSINKKDYEINRFILFLQRSILKLSSTDPDNGKIIFAYSFELETISDDIGRLWRTGLKVNMEDSKIREILELSKEGIECAFAIHYRTSPENIKKLMTIKDALHQKYEKLGKLDITTAKMVIHAIKIVESANDLSHLALMKHMKIKTT